MPAEPEVIFFDAAGTLIYLPRSVGEHYRQVALRFGLAPDAAALDRAFREAWKAAPERPATPGSRPDDDKDWWRDLVEKVFAAVLTAGERKHFDLSAYFEAVYAHFAEPGVWKTYPDVPDTLAMLRRAGYRLGVISNFDRRLRKVMADLGLAAAFEHLIVSSEVGADKPDPRIFAEALRLFGVPADRALHVGDDPHRDGGAEKIGLCVFRLDRPRHTLRDLLPLLQRTANA